MGYLIRDAQTSKVPYTIVVGDQEKENGTVTVRRYGEEKTTPMAAGEFYDVILSDIANYSRETK